MFKPFPSFLFSKVFFSLRFAHAPYFSLPLGSVNNFSPFCSGLIANCQKHKNKLVNECNIYSGGAVFVWSMDIRIVLKLKIIKVCGLFVPQATLVFIRYMHYIAYIASLFYRLHKRRRFSCDFRSKQFEKLSRYDVI